jgi:hypothetical protein
LRPVVHALGLHRVGLATLIAEDPESL